jgi:predicted dinucleotide-binding enzyme
LGSSITLGISRCFGDVKTICYAHRVVTRRKARELSVATEISGDLKSSVAEADIVILATPIFAFERVRGDGRGVNEGIASSVGVAPVAEACSLRGLSSDCGYGAARRGVCER